MNRLYISDEIANDLPHALDGMIVTSASIVYEDRNLVFTYYGTDEESGEETSRNVTIPAIKESER